MKPKLLIIHNRLVIGGPALDTIPLAHHLQNDFEIHILYGCKEKDETEPSFLLSKYPDLKLVNIPFLRRSPHVVNDLRSFNFISSYIKKVKPDIVHTHGAKVGFLGRIAARKNKVSLIVHTFHGHLFHSYFNSFFSSLLVQLEKRLAKITNVIVAISKSQQEELTRLLNLKESSPAKVVTIPLGVDYIDSNLSNHYMQAFKRQYHLEPNTVCIGMLGRMVPIKNPIFFLEVVRYILSRKHQVPLKFFVVGDGDQLPLMKDYLRTHGISFSEGDANDAVIFTSWVHNIQSILEGLDIVSLTSFNEGTPLSIIEAQICGKPVVAVNVGGVRDTMIAGETGFLIQQHSIEEFGDALILLVKDELLRKRMGDNAREFAITNFSKQKEVELLRKLYLAL